MPSLGLWNRLQLPIMFQTAVQPGLLPVAVLQPTHFNHMIKFAPGVIERVEPTLSDQ
jgi:hypothetical protein